MGVAEIDDAAMARIIAKEKRIVCEDVVRVSRKTYFAFICWITNLSCWEEPIYRRSLYQPRIQALKLASFDHIISALPAGRVFQQFGLEGASAGECYHRILICILIMIKIRTF